MKFKNFENMVKKYRPDIFKVFQHNHVTNGSKTLSTAIQFKEGGKAYIFNGSYGEILNKLNIEYTTEKELENTKNSIKEAKAKNGTKGLFDTVLKLDDEIERLEKKLEYLEKLPVIE